MGESCWQKRRPAAPARWVRGCPAVLAVAVLAVAVLTTLLGGCAAMLAEPAPRSEPWYALKHGQNVQNVVSYQPRALKLLQERRQSQEREDLENWEAVEARRRLGLARRATRERERYFDRGKFLQQLHRTFAR